MGKKLNGLVIADVNTLRNSTVNSIMILFLGVRKCNAFLINGAVAKLSQLVYGRNHPIYQNIVYHNAQDRVLMPSKLREMMEKYISGSKTKTLGKCQGGDAMLEELNKESKSWLTMSGIPSEEQCLHVFQNIDSLNEVK